MSLEQYEVELTFENGEIRSQHYWANSAREAIQHKIRKGVTLGKDSRDNRLVGARAAPLIRRGLLGTKITPGLRASIAPVKGVVIAPQGARGESPAAHRRIVEVNDRQMYVVTERVDGKGKRSMIREETLRSYVVVDPGPPFG